jgi:hypothetical protein
MLTVRISREHTHKFTIRANCTSLNRRIKLFMWGVEYLYTKGKIDGEVSRKTQSSSKFYKIIKGILWNT